MKNLLDNGNFRHFEMVNRDQRIFWKHFKINLRIFFKNKIHENKEKSIGQNINNIA